MNTPTTYRGYELVPVFDYKTEHAEFSEDGLSYHYVDSGQSDWEIFKEGCEKGTGLHAKTLEEVKQYVDDLIEE
jgi:hypothetical protein